MDLKKIEDFLINVCGYKSIEDAIKNTPKLDLYPIYGELPKEVEYEQVS